MSFGESVAGDLRPAPYNPRNISPRQMELLEAAMRKFGDLGGIVYNVRTGHIVGGHQRVKVLPEDAEIERVKTFERTELGTVSVGYVRLGDELFAYREVDWDPDFEALANIAANKHGGEFDLPAVRDILSELDTGELELELSGFDDWELEQLMTAAPPEDDGSIGDESGGGGAGDQSITVTCPDCSATFEVARKAKYEVGA